MKTMRFLDACSRLPVDATPVWLMRQAGRYLPEYRAIREKMSFVEMCRRPDIAAEVTLQPLRRFDLDAAIIFADILLPLEPMGIGFHFTADNGPVIEKPVRIATDLDRIHGIDPAADLPYVMDAIRLVRHELNGSTPLIGFSGAPFTLASYIVEGGHSRAYAHVKKMMYQDPATFERLMRIISDVVVGYLEAQIVAGAQVAQLFDSWVGWLGPYDYELLVLPHVLSVVERLKGCGVPLIYFANGASGMLAQVARAGCDVVGIDWRIELDRAWAELDGFAIQGNLDPVTLLGPPAAIEVRVADIMGRAGGRPGHIFNLGHGLIPQTPIDNVKYLVDAVHRLSTGRFRENGLAT
jgi:uroporphyrinogen decarboxylase